jgi:hypothetical protein
VNAVDDTDWLDELDHIAWQACLAWDKLPRCAKAGRWDAARSYLAQVAERAESAAYALRCLERKAAES